MLRIAVPNKGSLADTAADTAADPAVDRGPGVWSGGAFFPIPA